MSQEKVERYKANKENRKDEMKKQKRKSMITKICGGLAAIVVVIGIGYAIYHNAEAKTDGTDANNVNVTELNNYFSEMNMDVAMAEFADEETSGEAVSSSASQVE